MRVRLACFVVAALVVSAPAYADRHFAEANSAFAFGDGGSLLKGFSFGAAKTVKNHEYWVFGADVTTLFGSHDEKPLTQVSFLGQARYTVHNPFWPRNLFHAQGLVGGISTNDAVSHDTKWAVGFGGTTDFCFSQPAGSRGESPYGWAIRVQANYIRDLGSDKNLGRYTTGLVYRFEHP